MPLFVNSLSINLLSFDPLGRAINFATSVSQLCLSSKCLGILALNSPQKKHAFFLSHFLLCFVFWVCLMDSPVLNEEESSLTPRIKIEIILKTKTVFLHESTNKNFHIIYDICIIQQNILVSNWRTVCDMKNSADITICARIQGYIHPFKSHINTEQETHGPSRSCINTFLN